MLWTMTPPEPKTRPVLVAAGGLVALLLGAVLVAQLWGGGGDGPAPAPPPLPAPPPPVAAPPPAPVAPAAPPQGLELRGITGSGAIIGFPDGTQRLVPVGREVQPGLTVAALHPNAVVLRGAGIDYRLGFTGLDGATVPPAPSAAPDSPEAAIQAETRRYLLGMAPRQVNGRISGYTIRPGADLPALAAAGLRPGDLVVGVNGSELDQERLMDLAAGLANATRTVIAFERDGRRMEAVVRAPAR
jgi:type II secretory pathway component PulC